MQRAWKHTFTPVSVKPDDSLPCSQESVTGLILNQLNGSCQRIRLSPEPSVTFRFTSNHQVGRLAITWLPATVYPFASTVHVLSPPLPAAN